jgi:hypothetical protein
VKVVINACFGGFGISDAAYEKLGEWGVPIRRYTDEQRGPDGRYVPEPANEGEVIFDRELTPEGSDSLNDIYWKFRDAKVSDRFWDAGWLAGNRSHPLLLRVIAEMGEAANGRHAALRVVEIPDGVEYEIEEYDGNEHIAETHRTWR